MSALALCLYLTLFYFLPTAGAPAYQWLWVHAREKMPWLMLYHDHALVWNGAFYMTMCGAWMLCYAVCAGFRWLVRHDDAQWEGLFTGFARGTGLGWLNASLALLFVAMIVFCASNNYPVHGLLSAGLPVISVLCLPGLLPGKLPKKKKAARKNAPAETAAPAGSATPAPPVPETPLTTSAAAPDAPDAAESPDTPPSISAHTRELKPDEPPPINAQVLRERIRQAVYFAGAAEWEFRDLAFTPAAQPDPRLPDEPPLQVRCHIQRADYLNAQARPRPTEAGGMAQVAAEGAGSAPIRSAAHQLLADARQEPRYRVRKALDFAAGLNTEPAQDGVLRLPLQTLHDGAGTELEKALLAAALLQAGGFPTRLWRQQQGTKEIIGVAVGGLYDPDGYVPGVTLPDAQTGTVWRLCAGAGATPDADQTTLYPLQTPVSA